MIISLFVIFLSLSLVLILAGTYIKAPPVQLAGYLFLFIIGLVTMLGGIQYLAGETESYSYVCACCDNGTYTEGTFTTGYVCTGEPSHDCDYYDLDQLGCEANCCTYNETSLSCDGTTNCDCFTDNTVCTRYGCEWGLGQEAVSTCENGTELTVKNITTTASYTAYSGEIFQGVEVNHVIGFFLCLLSVFGWVITLTNLDRFDTNQDAFREYRKGGDE